MGALQTKVSTLQITLLQHQQELQDVQKRYGCLLREQDANRRKISEKLQQSSEQDTILKTSHETITKMTKELESSKIERDVQKEKVKTHALKIAVIESTFIDKEKEVMAAREEVLRIEREKNRTIESLKEQLTMQEKKARDELKFTVEQTSKKTKGVYKDEKDKIIKETSEVESQKNHIEKKYELAKRQITDVTKEKKEIEEVC